MEEVEFLCNRIGIVDHGKLLAIGEKEELKRRIIKDDKIELEVSSMSPAVSERIEKLEHIENLSIVNKKVVIHSSRSQELLANVLSTISKMNIKVLSMKIEEPNLESVFLNLTGRALRD
jgi:ABC-2 type transport system ATP-binding protein